MLFLQKPLAYFVLIPESGFLLQIPFHSFVQEK